MAHKISITGNLGKDPELRYTDEGKAVCTMSVASNDRGVTTWFRLTVWDALAENCAKYLTKGRTVQAWGRMQSDAKTGGPRIWGDPPKANYEVTAFEVEFLGGNGQPQDDGDEPF